MRITTTVEQRQIVSQRMCLSKEMLQMNNIELEHYLDELALENPLLEKRENVMPRHNSEHRPYRLSLSEIKDIPHSDSGVSLQESLHEQILFSKFPKLAKVQLEYLITELDERGYLPENETELHYFGNSVEQYEIAVKLLQSLEPAGIGARNLRECLLIQLERQNVTQKLPYELVNEHLEALAKKQTEQLARKLNVTVEEIAHAQQIIAKLNPKPSNGFGKVTHTQWVIPDIEVIVEHGRASAVLTESAFPIYNVDDFYIKMAADPNLTPEERQYFKAKHEQAKWVVDCLEKRRGLMEECATAIVTAQNDYFAGITAELNLISMTSMAEMIGVHISTLSRVVKNKYVLCRHGVIPLRRFFCREVSDTSYSEQRIMNEIGRIVAKENIATPYSDREIAEALACMGINLPRRTVSVYRERAGILPAYARKTLHM